MKTKNIGMKVCIGVFIFLLNLASSSTNDENDDSDSPISTEYLYEGPDGCNAEECYCTTDTTSILKLSANEQESSRRIEIKTLKCKSKTDDKDDLNHFLVIKLPQFLYDFKAWREQAMENVSRALTNSYVRVNTYLGEMKDGIVSRMSPYFDRIRKYAKKYYQCMVEDTAGLTEGHVENEMESTDDEVFAENINDDDDMASDLDLDDGTGDSQYYYDN